MSKNKSLLKQFQDDLTSKTTFGESKHKAKKEAKKNDERLKGIFSHKTYDAYIQTAREFSNWLKKDYHVRKIEDAEKHVGEYLQTRIDKNLSAWTVKKDAAALAKIYDCKSADFGVELPKRYRADVFRSRTNANEGHYSHSKNKEVEEFCKAVGVRRHELERLTQKDVYERDGKTYVFVYQGKGGKQREIEALSNRAYEIAHKGINKPNELVFKDLPTRADIHACRADYAKEFYSRLARDVNTLEERDIYRCRKELKGIRYDKKAMYIVSKNLGHNRISVIAQSYLV